MITALLRWPVALLALSLLVGCGQLFYSRTPTGSFAGRLTVEWIEPNLFIYRPDAASPLVYTTSAGRRIQPRTMYTDGGSIPRLFWSAPGLGPWDFAPGYIIHDWLFEQHHCKEGDWQQYDFARSAEVLAEAMKTQMVKAGKPEPTILWAVYEAVSGDIARRLWDQGQCKPPVVAPAAAPGFPARKPVPLKVIDFR
jgi:hypothetical protein